MLINYLALDVGTVRIGLATANNIAQIATPLPAITNNDEVLNTLATTVAENGASEIIVGWPRNLNGDETDQTRYVAEFVERLTDELKLPVHLQDEAVTSIKAEAELKSSGKNYEKGDIDSLSAVYILEDYLAEGVH